MSAPPSSHASNSPGNRRLSSSTSTAAYRLAFRRKAALPSQDGELPLPVVRKSIEVTPSARQKRKNPQIRGAEARQVRQRGRDIYTGDVCLTRVAKLVSGEGLLELDNWRVIDFVCDDMVDAFAQPQRLPITVFGELHHWTPDGLIRRSRHRDLLVEVKPLVALQPNPELEPQRAALVKERIAAMERAAEELVIYFLLMTEDEVRVEPRLYNAGMMFRALGSFMLPSMIADGIDALRDLPKLVTVLELAEAMPQHRDFALMIACCLDREGHLTLDRRSFFTPQCQIENHRSNFGIGTAASRVGQPK